MTDRELLELAAKAAGIADGNVFYDMEHDKVWNPLTDDGDALRLAVKCNIVPQSKCFDDYDRLFASTYIWDNGVEVCSIRETYKDDPYTAIRRAIVRAAAEIGKAMP